MSAAKPTTRARPKADAPAKPSARKAVLPAAAETAASPAADTPTAKKLPRTPATVLRKKELMERVAALSGCKKKMARDTVEATLSLMGEALDRGEELNLPPFGKARITRSRDLSGGTALMLKLRRPGKAASGKGASEAGSSASGKDPLADAGD